jgi:hypothetical protein
MPLRTVSRAMDTAATVTTDQPPAIAGEFALTHGMILVSGDRTFQPDDDGFVAALLPVEDHRGVRFDIVAWAVGNPAEWWTRWGLAEVLGESALTKADWRNEPVRLYATPERWLRSGNDMAVCILDWTANLRRILGQTPEVQCESTSLKFELERRLHAQTKPAFDITVATPGR